MPRHKHIEQLLLLKMLELFCPHTVQHKTYSRRFCRDELVFNIGEKLHLSCTLLPSFELFYHVLRGEYFSLALQEKIAYIIYLATDPQHRNELLKEYLQFAKRKQPTSTPCLHRFVQEFCGEVREKNHSRENLKVQLQKSSMEDLLFIHRTSGELLKKRKVRMVKKRKAKARK